MSPLHPRMAVLVTRLHAAHRDYHDAVAGLDDASGSRRPESDRWSIAEITDHLWRAEVGIVRLFRHLNQNVADLPVEALAEAVAPMGLNRAASRETRPMQSPPSTVPDAGAVLASSLAALDAARLDLLAAIEGSEGRAVGTLSFPHPILGPFDYYQWVVFTAEHEGRHALQVREVRQHLGLG